MEQRCRTYRLGAWAGMAGYAVVSRLPAGGAAVTPTDTRKAEATFVGLMAARKRVKLWDEALAQQIFLGREYFIQRMHTMMEPAGQTHRFPANYTGTLA